MNRKSRPYSTIASILLAIVLSITSMPFPETTNSGTSVAYSYNADGIRIEKTVDGTDTTSYLVDKNRPYAQVLEERDGSNNLQVSYVYGDDLISQDRGGVDSYYHYDGQLSTRVLSDPFETVTDTYTYDAFGNVLVQTGITENNYLYTGEQYDPNAGFYYLRARYYDSGIGRFITTDPCQGSTFDPPSLHKYLYTGADPVNNWDPSGRFSTSELLTTMAIQGTISGLISGSLSYLLTKDWKKALIAGGSGFALGAVIGGAAHLTKLYLAASGWGSLALWGDDIVIYHNKVIHYLTGPEHATSWARLGYTMANSKKWKDMIAGTRALFDKPSTVTTINQWTSNGTSF